MKTILAGDGYTMAINGNLTVIETKCYGVSCLCGSRRTARATKGERRRDCLDCGKSFVWRVVGGLPVAFAPETAAALEEASRV